MTAAGRLAGPAAGALALPALLLGLWWVLSAGSANFFLPPLSRIVATGARLWTWPYLVETVTPSLGRLLAGWLAAGVLGVALGAAIGLSRRLELLTGPVLEFFRAIPPPVFAPVLILILGIGDGMRLTLVALGSLWPVLLNTAAGVRSVDGVLADTARMLRMGPVGRLGHLVLPSAAPRISAGMHQALGLALIMTVISEMFAAETGLGAAVVRFQQAFAVPEMWSAVLLLGLLGAVLSGLYRLAEARMLWWHGEARPRARGRGR